MKIKQITNIIYKSIILFTLVRLILCITFRSTIEFMYFNVEVDSLWFSFYYILPFIISIPISTILKWEILTKVGRIYLPLFFILTISGLYINKQYWGYYFKRPTLFTEVKKASEILSITTLKSDAENMTFKAEIDSNLFKTNQFIPNLYYSNFERPFLCFEDNKTYGMLFFYREKYSQERFIDQINIDSITQLILQSSFLEIPKKGYEKSGRPFQMQIIELIINPSLPKNTSYISLSDISKEEDERILSLEEKKFLFISLYGGQISNDHYPFYELLIEDDKIIKKQKYFVDVAGFEGIEYSRLSFIIECLLLILVFLFYYLIVLIKIILR